MLRNAIDIERHSARNQFHFSWKVCGFVNFISGSGNRSQNAFQCSSQITTFGLDDLKSNSPRSGNPGDSLPRYFWHGAWQCIGLRGFPFFLSGAFSPFQSRTELGNFPDADGASDHEREREGEERVGSTGLFMCNAHATSRGTAAR